jgi:hypothetical protein
LAFGIKREELLKWKNAVLREEIAFITHYWYHPKSPNYKTVTKVGCANIEKLVEWGKQYGLQRDWIHERETYPHFDLIGYRQKEIMTKEDKLTQLERFKQ